MGAHFISFLGTGNYEFCRYTFQENISNPSRYVQHALLEILPPLRNDQTRVSLFLTQQAWEKHWKGNGLSQALSGDFPNVYVNPIRIPEGRSPNELWEIFQILYDQILEGDTIYVDITHSYRSVPMFGISLLSYARTLKQITLGGIYYGAIEALGPLETVKKIPPEERIAPIFDLTSVYSLLEWSTAVHLFLRTGRAEELSDLVRTGLKPILSDPETRRTHDVEAQKLADKLKLISLDFLTNRGEEIRKGEVLNQIHRVFSDLQGKELSLKPMEPLLSRIGEKIGGFRLSDIRNNYRAVEWCIQHGWIQQGITQLQETIITHMLELLNENQKDIPEKEKVAKRDLVSSVFHAKHNPAAQHIYQDCLKKNPHLAKRIMDHPFCEVAALPFNKLRDHRNDINHGGFVEKNIATRFQAQLDEVFKELKLLYKNKFKEDLY
ncbi:MAG: TM1812 family CRISPR-associated protein [Spirochaetes bacterium]|nr:TM1812 family CRISPR-associated protein [Spirochaetota bacterium]